jgi:hypothetical protein
MTNPISRAGGYVHNGSRNRSRLPPDSRPASCRPRGRISVFRACSEVLDYLMKTRELEKLGRRMSALEKAVLRQGRHLP